jgi:hypothetical protein
VQTEGYSMTDHGGTFSCLRSYDFLDKNSPFDPKLEKIDNFEDRLEYAKYISYIIEEGFQKPTKVYDNLLNWYECYRFDCFTKCAKKDPSNLLHMLNKDIFGYIKSFL